MVGVNLGVVLLQESEVLLGALSSVDSGGDGLGGRSDDGLLGVKLGELAVEIGGKRGSLGRGGGVVVSDDSNVGVLGLL